MRDTASLLPQLVKLNGQVKSGKVAVNRGVIAACKVYEDEMIPRAFDWVRKSGGDQQIVRKPLNV